MVYIIWSCCHSATKYMTGLLTISEMFKNVELAIKTAPSVMMHIQNYHYETRHYTTRDSKGNTHHRTKRVRVNTHAATEPFLFTQWQDQSPPASTLHYLSVLLLTRLHTYKTINYSPAALTSYRM
jgi:alpha-amylase/alpha-mannosidase (GH57 family)